MNPLDLNILKNIDIVGFDTSSREQKFLMSYKTRSFEISESVVQLVDILKICDTTAEAALKLSKLKNENYTEEDIEALYKKCITPLLSEEKTTKKNDSFLWRIELIPASIVALFPRFLKFLFNPRVMMALIVLIVLAEVCFFSTRASVFHIGHVDIFIIVGVLLLFVCSSIIHELGHATACSYCGSTPRGIGFGLYINFPVFYTDVSDIWRLSRKNRMIVNFGGVYFQLLFLLPLFVIYFITWNDIIKYFIFTINLNFIFTLNPFFKFDGYWIMTDLLGVPNLRTRSNEVFKYYWSIVRGKKTDKKPFLLSLQKSVKISFIAYSIIVNLFFLYYFCYILPRFIKFFSSNFPGMFRQLLEFITEGIMPPMGLIMGILGQILMLALIVFMTYKMISPLIKRLIMRKQK